MATIASGDAPLVVLKSVFQKYDKVLNKEQNLAYHHILTDDRITAEQLILMS